MSIEASAPQPAGSADVAFRSDPGRLTYTGATLKDILAKAYNLRPAQIDGPPWLDEDRFDITAKFPAGASRDQVPAMLWSMLAERFKIVAHRESKEQPVYGLLVAKSGPKLKRPGETAGPGPAGATETVSEGHVSGGVWNGSGPPPVIMRRDMTSTSGAIHAPNVTLTSFAKILSNQLDRPVIDMTGIAGEYDFDLARGVDIGSGLQGFGLKLESRKAPADVLIVELGQRRPTGN